jgi:glycosyltransferase XagB
MTHLTPNEAKTMLRHKIVPYCWLPHTIVHGVVHEEAADEAAKRHLNIIGRVRIESFRRLIAEHFSTDLLKHALTHLARLDPLASARTRLTFTQSCLLGFGLVVLMAFGVFGTVALMLNIIAAICGMFFMMIVSLRWLCILPLPPGKGTVAPLLADEDSPVYSVLVPLFRETSVLQDLITALRRINYPQAKLDIKIILEAEDRAMHVAVSALRLPSHFDVIIVPKGKLQTKPRALNYALPFARGDLITIYDGEDQPDPNQLRLAAAQFARSSDKTACLQAALDFDNPDDNWLTRQFAAEYAGLFHVILPALAAYRLPLPLGGTSNHFRASALNHVGAWDAYNVTEDADLGIRLARHGYKTGILHSSTLEEANSDLSNWLKQRRRWLKGFLQTWLVHMRRPVKLLRQTGLAGFCTIQAMTIGVFASSLLHPILLALTCWKLATAEQPIDMVLAVAGFVVLLAGYVTSAVASIKGLARIRQRPSAKTLITLPGYWLLMSAAAWMALWDFAVSPFHWHKTRHGLRKRPPDRRVILRRSRG